MASYNIVQGSSLFLSLCWRAGRRVNPERARERRRALFTAHLAKTMVPVVEGPIKVRHPETVVQQQQQLPQQGEGEDYNPMDEDEE